MGLKTFVRWTAMAFAAAMLMGCGALGKNVAYQPFDAEKLKAVAPGRATAGQICEMFGAPTQVVELTGGNAYIYERSVAKATGAWLVAISFVNYDEQYDRLVFFFDTEGTLTHYGYTLHADKAGYGLPF